MGTRYSYSRLSSSEKCQIAHGYKYADKWYPAGEMGIEAFVGIIAHEVIEQDHKTLLTGDQPWQLARKMWETKKANQRLLDAKGLGEAHWYQYLLKAVNNYVAMGRTQHEVIGIEKRVSIAFLQGDELMGFIDRLVLERPPNGIVVEDFKSGKYRAKKYFEADHQLPLYAEMAIQNLGLDPGITVPCRRIYIGEKKIDVLQATPKRRQEAIAWAEKRAKAERLFLSQFAIDREAEPTEGPLCNWCSYRDRGCPAKS